MFFAGFLLLRIFLQLFLNFFYGMY